VLTTGVDAVPGTANNDTIVATNATLNAGDAINGGAGTDTLLYIDSSAAGAAPAAGATYSSVENINVRNVAGSTTPAVAEVTQIIFGAMAAGDEFQVAGTMIEALNTATAAEVFQAFVSGQDSANVRIMGHAVAGQTMSLGPVANSVVLTATNAGDQQNIVAFNLKGNGAATLVVTEGANAVANSPDLNVNAATFTGATSFGSDASIGAVTFEGLAAGQSLAKLGGAAALTGNYGAAVTSGTLNISGGSTDGAVTIGGAGLTTLNVTSTGAANTVGGIAAAAATTVNINATTNLTTGLVNTAKSTINVSGTAETVTLGVLDTDVATVNASGLTAGGVTLSLSAVTQKVTGGAGKDVITVGTQVLTTGSVDGGAGADTVIFSAGAALTKDTGARISNVETMQVGGNAQTYDFSLISGLSDLRVGEGTDIVVNKLGATTPVTVIGNQTNNLALNLANATGAADAMTVTLQNQNAAMTVAKLSVAGVETLNLVSSATKGTEANTVSKLEGNADLARVAISGSQALSLTTGNLVQSLTIDGSSATGALTIVAGIGGIATITTGSGKDAVTGSAQADAINTGEGADTITLTAGADVVNAGGGDDAFVAGAGFTATAGLTLDGGAGVDALKVDGAVSFDVAAVTLLNIEGITFAAGGATATFSGAQLSGRAMAITGGAGTDVLTVNAAVGSSVDLSGLTFTSWTAGTDGLNLNGAAGGETLRGSVKDDVITGGDGRDTINLSDGGSDTVVMTGIVAAANRDAITGFTVGSGTGFDVVNLGKANTTADIGTVAIQEVAAAPNAGVAFNTTLTTGNNILELSFNLAGDGTANDLDNFTDGTGLLALASLGQTLAVSASGNAGFVVAYQGGNAYLYRVAEAAGDADATVAAADMALIGVFNNIAVGGFVSQNFAMVA